MFLGGQTLANLDGRQNHNPMAENGAQNALDLLSPFWGTQNITVLRTKFAGEMSWLNYRSGFGDIVDRYRWDAGCIIEHVRFETPLLLLLNGNAN